MFTLLLAWIHATHKETVDFDMLYVGTVLIDMAIVECIGKAIAG